MKCAVRDELVRRAAEGGANRSADVAIRLRATAKSEGPNRSVAQRVAMTCVTRGGMERRSGKGGAWEGEVLGGLELVLPSNCSSSTYECFT